MGWKDIKIDNTKLKRCPECGNFFSCSTDDDCWCHDYQLNRKKMIMLMNTYDDCICPDCLKNYEEL